MTTIQIRQRLESILDFMQPYWEFVNCHMVKHISDKHWEKHIPLELREEISSVQKVRDCIETCFWNAANNTEINTKYPVITNFIQKSKNHRLSNFKEILKTTTDLQNELEIICNGDNRVSIKEFMNDKKRHEVEIMADVVNELIARYTADNSVNEVFIVDAGDGKGYLSSRLALQYNHKVLGIDANESNTENALQRSRKLQRAWNGLVQRAELIERGITPPRRGKKVNKQSNSPQNTKQNSNYCTTARYVDTDLNMTALLSEFFPEIDERAVICLTGLHTCGNLAATCLRVFHEQPSCKLLCNIGCCYHFLKEAYTELKDEHERPNNVGIEIAFPMSKFLQEKHFGMGRNARMLAAQSIERTLTACELPNISIFYRALLEELICQQNPSLCSNRESVQVGRIRKFENFEEYVQQCAKKTDLIQLKSLNTQLIRDIETKYANDRPFLELFYLLRMLFAPILETIILLDRLLFLTELGYQKSFLVSAFDAVISPRHYAIIAIKN